MMRPHRRVGWGLAVFRGYVVSLIITHGLIITAGREFAGDIRIDGGRISGIGSFQGGSADTVVDASGLLVIPGGVDVHTHLEAPVGGTMSSDDFASGTRAAAFGGTTCIVDFATQSRGEKLMPVLDAWRHKGEKAVIDYGLHMIVTDTGAGQLDALGDLVREGVTSFKLFMAYPGSLMVDDGTIYRIMRVAGKLGALVSIHAENGWVIEQLIRDALAAGDTAPRFHARTRPASAEGEATNRAITLAAIAGVPVYIVHVTCRESLEAIVRARETGERVFGETCPQYLLLSAADLERPGFEGAKYVLTPPLRGRADQEALWNALGAGNLQAVATDHCPFMFRGQKDAGKDNFTRIPNGGPGIENRMELLFHYGVNQGRVTAQQWVDLCSASPARMFGLYPRKGEIAPGADADIVLWDPEMPGVVRAAEHHMNVDYSMYEGLELKGRPRTVIAGGDVVVDGGRWIGGTHRGRYIPREPFGAAYRQGP